MNSPTSPARASRIAACAGLALWTASTIVALVFWARDARDLPYGDTWAWVPAAVGAESTVEWIVSFHNVHFIPVTKLLFLAVGVGPGYDFRALPLLGILLVSVASLLLMRSVWAMRGRARLTDAVFPLAMLHLGHGTNFLICDRNQYLAGAAFAALLLSLIARSRRRFDLTQAALVGACLLALAGCGINGLVFVPPALVWLALTQPSLGWSRRRSLAALACALPAASILLVYWFEMPRTHFPDEAEQALRSPLIGTLNVLSIGFGRLSEGRQHLAGAVFALLCGTAMFPIVRGLRSGRSDRFCAIGLLAFLASMAVLTASVGWGRRSEFNPRYVTMITPALGGAYLAWTLWDGKLGRVFQSTIFLIVALVAINEARGNPSIAHFVTTRMDAFVVDARAGTPSRMLAARFIGERNMARYVPLVDALREGRLGPFRDGAQSDDRFRPITEQAGQWSRSLTLEPGEATVQQFVLPPSDVPLRALHVLARPLSRQALVEVVLRELGSGSEEPLVVRQPLRLGQLATLAFGAYQPQPGTRLELTLEVDDASPWGVRVEALSAPGRSDLHLSTSRISESTMGKANSLDIFLEYER